MDLSYLSKPFQSSFIALSIISLITFWAIAALEMNDV